MRLSELAGKKIINIYDGDILGTIGDSDLLINEETGEIESIILPMGNMGFSHYDREILNIPWKNLIKIGAEVVVVDVEHSANLVYQSKYRR